MTELVFSPEVEAARTDGRPVVALESTILTHGLPKPDNLAIGREIEAEVRQSGAVPATIAVLGGEARIGLSDEDLAGLCVADSAVKLSRRDLGIALSQGLTGGTTVAATMILAARAGIEVFATGGIGGVHRGAEQDFDISADLDELARTPVMVVSAGAKSILDLPKTLEVLETRGVPVIGYRTDEFPAFFCRVSGLKVPLRLDSMEEIAGAWRAGRGLGLESGMLVANPVPEEFALERAEMERIVEDALYEAKRTGTIGKQVTPYLLSEIRTATGGASLRTNIELVRANARLASGIAVSLGSAGR
ncbi:pseudouridine-5'-phosphate glycosidase [Nisaea acidiphila]|uniref:Pseudouridine-5'-phosphate glycosidase n=1 Tax=Nisaea acidiphila TaxID=1862145 RepID=A0A9J7AT32_9PROT|nr:pseudouridine-5'-phosphate glycosidase [Nisaea acidiphila]UUX49649.1 pseudouridine-5'-phosphate glycosidase [Nisaea acidiphila]